MPHLTMPDGFKHYVKTFGKSMTIVQIAESYQVTTATIRNWMKREGIPNRQRENAVDKSRIDSLLRSRKSTAEIMGILKCGKSIVNDRRRSIGMGRKRKRRAAA